LEKQTESAKKRRKQLQLIKYKTLILGFQIIKKILLMRAWRPQPKSGYPDVPAWLSLILAAHRVPLRGVRRESHRVIRSAANTAMNQARTSGMYSRQFFVFYTPQGGTEKSDSLSGVRH